MSHFEIQSEKNPLLKKKVQSTNSNDENNCSGLWGQCILTIAIGAIICYALITLLHGEQIGEYSTHDFKYVQFHYQSRYLRCDNGKINSNIIATENIPWLHGSTFKLHIGENKCWYLLAMNGRWVGSTSELVLGANVDNNDDALCLIPSFIASSGRNSELQFRAEKKGWLSVRFDDKQLTEFIFSKDKQDAAILTMTYFTHVRGVNLGGWFIPEVWMTPSFFSGSGLGWGGSLCGMVAFNETETEHRIKSHLSTWVTEDDFDMMHKIGITSIRLPIGYWNVISDPYGKYAPKDYAISLSYIDWCFDMAEQRNMTVIVDMHGGPGSQNGIDHSGCAMNPEWTDILNVQLSLQAIQAISERYANRSNLLGFELLNEPGYFIEKLHHDILLQYYKDSYVIIRKYSKTAYVIFNELYSQFYDRWNNTLREPDYYNVVMDMHLYDWQEPYTEEDANGHIRDAMGWSELIRNYSVQYPIIVGEWCMSSGTHVQAGQKFVNASLTSFRNAIGSYIWNWKIESGIGFSEWDLQYQYLHKGLYLW
jgi:glucan 1,3-beta-glucosidase